MAEYRTYEKWNGNVVIEEVEPSYGGGDLGVIGYTLMFALLFPLWGPIYFLYKQLELLFGSIARFITVKYKVDPKLVRAYRQTLENDGFLEGLEPAVVPYVWTEDYKNQVAAIRKKYSHASEDVIQSKIKALRGENDRPKPFVRYRYGNKYYFSLDADGNLICKLGVYKGYIMDGYDWEKDLSTLGYELPYGAKREVMDFFFGE